MEIHYDYLVDNSKFFGPHNRCFLIMKDVYQSQVTKTDILSYLTSPKFQGIVVEWLNSFKIKCQH